MEITVKFFATFKDRVGAKQVTVELPDDATVATLYEYLVTVYPALAPAMDTCVAAINRQFAFAETKLQPGDEVALFPPVSGGSV